jgi:hypothetical protein
MQPVASRRIMRSQLIDPTNRKPHWEPPLIVRSDSLTKFEAFRKLPDWVKLKIEYFEHLKHGLAQVFTKEDSRSDPKCRAIQALAAIV